MARKLRSFAPGLPVHVVQRGVNRCDIFANDDDRRSYKEFLTEAADNFGTAIHCYVLMGNHVHLLATPGEKDSLPATMHNLNTRYAWHFNTRHERTGALFEGRYKANLVDTDRYLKACYQYIDLNPVKAGFCKHPNDYCWSSHRCHAFGDNDSLITFHNGYLLLGESPETRQSVIEGWFLQPANEREIEQIRSGV